MKRSAALFGFACAAAFVVAAAVAPAAPLLDGFSGPRHFVRPGVVAIAAPSDAAAAAAPEAAPAPTESTEPLPVILRSESDLPEPVREMRAKLIEAAKSGDIEKLRPLMDAQPKPPSVAFGDPGDPIEYLKALAADADGREILAILLEVLQSGFVHVGEGTDDDHYVWPYFAEYPLNALTPEQLVELFTLLTAADYEDMKSYGAYTFFRVGIAPDGRWLFFLAGD
jgi:hypothetical protein